MARIPTTSRSRSPDLECLSLGISDPPDGVPGRLWEREHQIYPPLPDILRE